MRAEVRSDVPHVWEIRVSKRKNLVCWHCGKRFSRYKTIKHKVGIVNRHPDGRIKVSDEVLAEVNAEMDAWQPEPDCGKHIVDVVKSL